MVLHFQPVCLGHDFKLLVVIHAVIAGVLDGFWVAVRVEDFLSRSQLRRQGGTSRAKAWRRFLQSGG